MAGTKSISITVISKLNLIAISVLVLILVIWLGRLIGVAQVPFDTDEADHAISAYQLYFYLTRLDLGGAFQAIARQGFYPPLNSVLVAISYLFFGPTLISSRIPGLLQFCAYLVVMAFTTRRLATALLQQEYRQVALISVVALSAFSPIAFTNASLCMLEPTGLLVTALILYSLVEFERSGDNASGALLGLLLILIVLTKYSFGVMVVPAVLLGLTTSCLEGRIRPAKLVVIYGLVFVSLGLWLLLTNFDSVIHFFVGHRSYAPILSQENLLFDLRGFLSNYTPNWATALFVVVFGIDSASKFQRVLVIRSSALITILSLLILGASSTNEERHFIVASPGIFLLAGIGIARFCQGRTEYRFRMIWWGTLAVLILSFSIGIDRIFGSLPRTIKIALEGEGEYNELQEFVMRSLDPSATVIVNGTDDTFNIQALRWKAAIKSALPYTAVKWDEYPSNSQGKALTDLFRNKNVDRAWQDEKFPKAPFEQILNTGYYRYAVQIKNLLTGGFRDEADREFFNALKDYPNTSQFAQAGRRVRMRVTIYDLGQK